ncbi:MAG: glycosyltransferase family 39 protein, partial [Chloroflexi bacterium]|nr:glycosyltransferase family 39 protein [Chloroflexota bacterium]
DRESPLNPHWFPYGSFPLYLLKLASATFSFLDMRLVGRALSALFDVGTVSLVYLLGSRLYGRGTGLLGAAFTAVTVLHIQLSHFYTSDVLLTTFAVATLFFLARGIERRDVPSALLAGVSLGLAVASKASAALLFIPVLGACVLQMSLPTGQPLGPRLRAALGGLLVISGAAALTAMVAQPYALLDWSTYLGDIRRESAMAQRAIDLPYTRQYIGTTAYLYPLEQLLKWGMGLPLGLAALGGLAFGLWRGLARRQWADLLLLSWIVPYFALVGSFEVKFLRYMLPLLPFLSLMAARGLLAARVWTARLPRPRTSWATAVIAAVLTFSALYALSYVNIYSQPHPAVRLAHWAQANLPPGSRVVWELWDEGLRPMSFGGLEIDPYNDDSPEKLDRMVKVLEQANYIYLFGNRMYGTIPRLPERYPVTTRYYQMLFSGELGFRLARAEASYPNLLGISLTDDTFSRPSLPPPAGLDRFLPGGLSLGLGYADESFTVYDHPLTMLFEKTPDFDSETVRSLLAQALTTPSQSKGPGLLLSPGRVVAQQAGGTWSQIFLADSLSQRYPIVVWLLFIEGLALTTLPLSWLLFRPLADRGYLLNKALSLLLLALVPWWLASLGWLPFTSASIGLGWALLAAVSAHVAWHKRRELLSFFRAHWRLLVTQEALFLAAFFGFLALRVANPDLWHMWRGGEKPMDFAYLNAVLRSDFMPPYDPWFAGGYLNYYYLGQFLAAVPIKLTGIRPEVAYNLVVPLFFALTIGGAFGVVHNLVRASGGRASSAHQAGAAGAAFVAVLGNLDGLLQMGGALLARLGDSSPPLFDYWRSTRMMPPSISITEFPFFTFLFSDLHAHLLALPFTLLAIGLAVALALDRTPAGWTGFRQQAPLLASLALVLGALRGTNSWDFPTYLLLGGLALAIAGHAGQRPNVREAILTLLKIAVLYGLSTLLFLPFHQRYQFFYTGVTASPERTPLSQYFLIHGLFLFLTLGLLAGRLWPLRSHILRAPWRISLVAGAFALALALGLLGGSTPGFLTLAGLTVVALATILGASPGQAQRPWLLVLALIALAAALGIGVDLVTLEGDIVRMNTVFKFYLQAWVLWALAAAYALWWLWPRARGWPWLGRGAWLTALALLLMSTAIYPVAGTRARLADRFQVLSPSLDGTAYMRESTYQYPSWCNVQGTIALEPDLKAIRWLRENVPGSPVIAEAVTPIYCWGSRISIYTGLPTIIGWEWHQRQQRWDYQWMVEERLRDVDLLYRATDPAAAQRVISKYRVQYIVVGAVERLYYPPSGLAKFENMPGIQGMYHEDGVEIFRVLNLAQRPVSE